MLTLLLTTLVLSAQSSFNVNTPNNIAPDADAAEAALLACGLSLDHEDVYCADSESGVITVNLSTNEVGDFTLNWATAATPIQSSTVTITAGQIDVDSGLFQGNIATAAGLTPGVYNLTVTTPEGLTCLAQATIFITDFQDPVITCPLPIVVNAPIGACEITIDVSDLAIGTDSCGVTIESDIQEVTAGVGVTSFPVIYTATDGSGNVTTALCDIEVTVKDEEGPTIQCPISIDADTDDGECGAVVEWGVTAEDNCPGVVVTTMCIYPDATVPVACESGIEYPIGTTLVLGTATDASNNQANCAFEIVVADEEDPVVDCPANIEVSSDLGSCGAIVTFTPTATDNCDVLSEGTDIASGTFFAAGTTTTVTYTATDAAGNSATCEFTVTVTDDEDPVLTCPADATITTSSNGTGDCAAEVPDFIPGLIAGTNGSFSDNCSATAVQSPVAGTVWGEAHGDTQAVVITVTDGNGNTATCELTLTLDDNEDPTFLSCPGDISTGNDDGECSAVVDFIVTPDDNCTVSLSGSHASGDAFPLGTTTVTYIATDAAGNSATCEFDVIVTDNEEPNVMCPSNIEVDNDLGACGAIVTYATSFTDNCPGGSFTISHVSGTFFPIGTTTVTYSAIDASGQNGAVCTFDVVVTDAEDPILACPADVLMPTSMNGEGDCIAQVPDFIPGLNNGNGSFSDNCGATATQSPAAGTGWGGSHLSTQDVVITVTDAAGNSTTCSLTLTLDDDEDPVINNCPADIQVSADAGANCTAVVNWTPPTPTDNCTVTMTASHEPGAMFSGGVTTVSYVATDEAGNTTTCSFDITVGDSGETPVCNDTNVNVTLPADDNCVADHSWTPPNITTCETSTPANSTCTHNGVQVPCDGPFPLGVTTVEFSAPADVCNFTITVEDNTPPTVSPEDVIMQTSDNNVYDCVITVPNYEDEFIGGVANPLYNADDNCSVTVTQDPAPGTPFEDGGVCADPIVVTITADDGVNPPVVETAMITLEDDVDPLITCPQNIMIQSMQAPPEGCLGEEVTIPVPVFVEPTLDANGDPIAPTNPADPATGAYTDDCDCVDLTGPVVGNGVTLDANNTGLFPLGTTTVSYTATDAAGNTATCTFTVEVLPPNAIIECNGSDTESATLPANANCEATHAWTSPTLNACGTMTPLDAICVYDGTSYPCASGDIFQLGTTEITYDSAPQCNLSVTVVDGTPPELTCPADADVLTSVSGIGDCIDLVPDFIPGLNNGNGSFSDNCSTTVTQFPAPGTPWGGSHEATQLVTITVEDGANPANTISCDFTLTLIDDEDPIFTSCPIDMVVPNDSGDCSAVVTFDVLATDNCTVSVEGSHDSGDTFPVGTTTVTYTATDDAGNSATCSFDITVEDTEDPVVACPADITVGNDAGECGAMVEYDTSFTDNCPNGTDAVSIASGTFFAVGTTTVTYTATDAAGNTATCDFTVTVVDNEPPTFDGDDVTIPTSANGVYDCGVAVPNYVDEFLTDGSANPDWINLQDNCGAIATQDVAPGTIVGTCHGQEFPVVITVNDDIDNDGVADVDGNTYTETVTVTIVDDVDPLIACPANVVLNTMECEGVDYDVIAFMEVDEMLDASGNPLTLDPYTYADDCSTAAGCLQFELVDSDGVTLADGDSGIGTFPPGTTTLTYTVTDGAGNTATCSYTVTVIVEEEFTINCPSNIKVPNDLGECGADVYWNPPIVSGSCTGTSGGSAPATSCVYPDGTTGPCGIGDFFPVGITVVTYEGAMPACSFEVRVLDTEKPITECPDDITVSVAGVGCKAWVSWNKPTPSDNCGVVSMNGTHINTGMYFPVGTTTVIYKAADAAGNTGTCNFTITVIDNLDPAASCPDDITLAAPGTATWTPPNPVDNCVANGVLIQATHEPGAFFDETTTVTYMFEDAAGNIDECSFTVNVDAGTSPRVAGRVAMEGASMNGGGMMRDDLRMSPLMPTSFGLVTPYGGSSATSTTMLSGASNTNSAVDWILIEIRDANNPAQVLMTRSALVQRDGDIMAADGSSSVTLAGLSNGNYHVAVRHRNHLGVMTATPVYLDANAPMLDFTDANFQTWGTNARVNVNGKMAMIAGDSTGDGAVTAADRSDIWNNRNTQSYMTQDCDMNGATTAADRNISYNNRNTIEQLPQ